MPIITKFTDEILIVSATYSLGCVRPLMPEQLVAACQLLPLHGLSETEVDLKSITLRQQESAWRSHSHMCIFMHKQATSDDALAENDRDASA